MSTYDRASAGRMLEDIGQYTRMPRCVGGTHQVRPDEPELELPILIWHRLAEHDLHITSGVVRIIEPLPLYIKLGVFEGGHTSGILV